MIPVPVNGPVSCHNLRCAGSGPVVVGAIGRNIATVHEHHIKRHRAFRSGPEHYRIAGMRLGGGLEVVVSFLQLVDKIAARANASGRRNRMDCFIDDELIWVIKGDVFTKYRTSLGCWIGRCYSQALTGVGLRDLKN